MTPKEKAEELYDNMLEKMPHPDTTNANVHKIAKNCALIAVNEIINTFYLPVTFGAKKYWEEVKQEIEAL